jgi:hypothetical protein
VDVVFCVLNHVASMPPVAVRATTHVLEGLGLLAVDRLARVSDNNGDLVGTKIGIVAKQKGTFAS